MLHLLVTWPVLVSCAPVCKHLFPAQLLTLVQLQRETRSRVRARYGEHLVQLALFAQSARAISLFSPCFFLYRSCCCRAWCRWCFRVNLPVIPRSCSVRLRPRHFCICSSVAFLTVACRGSCTLRRQVREWRLGQYRCLGCVPLHFAA